MVQRPGGQCGSASSGGRRAGGTPGARMVIVTLVVCGAIGGWCALKGAGARLATLPTTGSDHAASTDAACPAPQDGSTSSSQQSDGEWVEILDARGHIQLLQLCQSRCLVGVACDGCNACGEASWDDRQPIPWEELGQGEYVGPYRDVHVPEYRLRVGDLLEFVYRLTRVESQQPYELNVGDRISIESLIDPTLDRELVIQPDGMVTLRMLGQVRAARRTVMELQKEIEDLYRKYYKVPAITVTPLQVNTRLEDLRAAVDSRYGQTGGQAQHSRVTPEGTIQLPGIESVPAQGLTLEELAQEIEERYRLIVDGIGVTPRLLERAERFVYVVGEVRQPGRYVLEAPTTAMQAIALASGWNNGGNLREIVVFRRDEHWRLMATKLDLRGALLGERPCPADEIWLRDSDIVVVPKSSLMRANDFIELLFTRGIYGVLPMQGVSLNFQKLSSL